MAAKFDGFDDEEDDVLAPKEPQVTSQDPNERKAGRALRIKRRQDALKRAEQTTDETSTEEEPGPIEHATATAAEELQRLSLEGAAKVTNVKVTTDEREVNRRELFSEKMRTEAQIQYDAISAHWEAMLKIKDPLDIDVEINNQRKKCEALLEQKNQLIDELKQELKRTDDAYYEDLDKQDKEIKELSDRIEKQVTIMQRAYEKQLSLIEQAIDIEREAMVDHNNKRWEALYKQRDKEEVAHMEYKFEQVLKKREEENVFVRSQQKRRLNKMSDVANNLRVKIRKAAEDGAIEEMKADAEIIKLMQTMDDLEKKSHHFSHVNNYKFSQVWRMSESQCVLLSRDIRNAEVALHAHILAEPPPPPPPRFPKSPLSKYGERSATKVRSSVIARSVSASTSRSIHVGFKGRELSPDELMLMEEADEIIQKCGDPQGSSTATGVTSDAGTSGTTRRAGTRGVTVSSLHTLATNKDNPFLCPAGHFLEIEPMQVLTALNEFMTVFVPPDKKKLHDILESVKPPDFTTPSRRLTSEEIAHCAAEEGKARFHRSNSRSGTIYATPHIMNTIDLTYVSSIRNFHLI
ncbi:unnamed protein product, partial [Iphiclides podalirius]